MVVDGKDELATAGSSLREMGGDEFNVEEGECEEEHFI